MQVLHHDVAKVFGWMALFKGLTPSQISAIAKDVEIKTLYEGDLLFKQGDSGDSFYIIISGKLRVTRGRGRRAVELANLIPGDYVGEEALLYGTPRTATVAAAVPSRLARFSKAAFERLMRISPQMRAFLAATVSSRRLTRKQKIDWLDKEETVYLMVRKHIAYLLISLVPPLLLAWVCLPFFYLNTQVDSEGLSSVLNWIGILFVVLGAAWGVWRYIDWGNDFYIVTNQRVIWIERVVLLSDSRQEAPLATVLTVGITRDFFGRLLGYGDVIIRTFTGQIVMQHVGFPEQLAGLVEEQLSRAKAARKREEMAALEGAIHKRLYKDENEEDESPAVVVRPRKKPKPNLIKVWFSNFFKVRYEEDGVVTFRKHWILLVSKIWLPTLIIIGLLAALIGRIANWYVFLPTGTLAGVIFVILVGVLLWWIYLYVDWKNDLYQVTDEQIVDVYRKPLGQEDKKTAQLENILSLEHTRYGIIGLVLNYGDVVAMVGGTKFTFDGVYNPANVEQEIFIHINQRKRKIAEVQAATERERIADWFEAYHRQTHTQDEET